jgi:hypothetical protein
MSSRRSSPAGADFLPRRAETLRESFQEKMRQRGSQRAGSAREDRSEVRFLEMAHGPHPDVDRLNNRFLPGSSRLRVTLDVLGLELRSDEIPPPLVPNLLEIFPRLERHRCCGGDDVHSSLLRRWRHGGSDSTPGDRALDFCHLLGHITLELVRGMVPSATCAGITCAYREPAHRFDLFIECEDARVGAAALRCAAHVLLALIQAGQAPAGASRYAETARYFLGRPRSVLNPGEVLAALQGDPPRLEEALRFLAAAGFLVEDQFTADFGETILYRFRLAPDLPPLPVSLPL